MSTLYMMVTIAERSRLADFVSLYRANGLTVHMITLGRGTANSDMLSYFGLSGSEKAICLGIVTGEIWVTVKRALETKIRIDVPGTGIAFIVPMSSIGGKRELRFLTDSQTYEKGEESTLKETVHELLVVIANQGYNDLVMDTARAAGAPGGTVIHARGTGMEQAERFLGISLASEKDIIFIVVKTAQKHAIMESIIKHAGMNSEAKAIVFSLPVTDTAGLRIIEPEDTPEN